MDSPEKAVAIFQARVYRSSNRALGSQLARQYGVTPKAVRDIWLMRTWMHATRGS